MNWMAIDVNGIPITPLFTYADSHPGTVTQVARLKKQLEKDGMLEEMHQRTGTPIHTGYLPILY